MAEMPRYSSFSGEPGASLRPHHTAGCTGLYPSGGGDIWQCTLGPGRYDLEETGALGSEEGIPLPLVTGELCHPVLTFYLVCLILSAIRANLLCPPTPCGALLSSLRAASCWNDGEILPIYARGSEMGQLEPSNFSTMPTQKTLSAWENKQKVTSWGVFWVFL